MTPYLAPGAYADLIDLHTIFDRSAPDTESRTFRLQSVAEWLLEDAGVPAEPLPVGDDAKRRLITHLITVRPARPIPSEMLQKLDAVFAEEASQRDVVRLGALAAGSNRPS